MSYAHKKLGLFKEAGDALVVPKRCQGLMKSYFSATDTRAWSGTAEERRQYFLDVIQGSCGKSLELGRYIPVEVIIDSLLASKDAETEKLKKQLEELQKLLDAYSQLDLTEDQKRKLEQLKGKMGIAGSRLRERSGKPDTDSKSVNTDDFDDRSLGTQVKEKNEEIAALKNLLKSKEAYYSDQRDLALAAIEQLENIKGIIEERDDLKQRLKRSEEQLETLKKQLSFIGGPDYYSACQEEIDRLEQEIDAMRRGKLTPEQEAQIIRKEVDVLKKYCAKLRSIQEENQQLKKERNALKEQLKRNESPDGQKRCCTCEKEVETLKRELKNKLKKLEQVTSERDSSKSRLNQMEEQLQSFTELSEEVEIYKRKSSMLDDVTRQRDSLHKRLEELKGLDEEAAELKRKADRVDELERLLAQMQKGNKAEVLGAKSECVAMKKQVDNIKAERNMLQSKLNVANCELNQLRNEIVEMDMLKLEKDRLQKRLNELADMEDEYHKMLCRLKCFETIKNERNMFKAKYEELLGLECECNMLKSQLDRCKCFEKERDAVQKDARNLQCIIAQQEEEIKKLSCEINCLNQRCSAKQQSKKELCPCNSSDDKVELAGRISTLENELLRKQKHAQQKLLALQMTAQLERKKMEELKRSLEKEKQRSSDLQSKMEIHTKAVVNLQVERDLLYRQNNHYQDKLNQYMDLLDREREKVDKLQEELERERQQTTHLANQVQRAKCNKKKDNESLRMMKELLEKTLNNEMKLRMQLEERDSNKSNQLCQCILDKSSLISKDASTMSGVPKTKTRTCCFRTKFEFVEPKNQKQFPCHCRYKESSSQRSCPRKSQLDHLDIDET